jgi:hypothetical protein
MMSYRILPAALLLCTLAAACGESPTGSDTQAQPAGASYDGGFTMGSGNRGQSEGDTTVAETTTTSGGFTMGSGNLVATDGEYGMGSGNHAQDTAAAPLTTTGTTSGDSAGRGGFTMGSGN